MKLGLRLAAVIVGGWLLVAIASSLWPPAAVTVSLPDILAPPGTDALLGRDDLGRSVLARLAAGARISLAVAAVVVTVTAVLGTALGLVAGFCGGVADSLLLRLTDVFLAFPGILLAIALAGVLGPGIGNVMIALSVVGWVGFARLARAQTLSVKQRDHVHVAHALGVTPLRIVLRHVLPLIAGPLIVEASFACAAVIVAEAGLSFLGLGVQPPTPSWGNMIRDGARYVLVAPHLVIAPGVALASLVVAINLLGDGLRDRLAPQRR
ncbi:MAG: ABC transporter permease [Gammaproteobacteria bacterium]|nr:ABC transporter permease [Gammaproteobacteria bacterium]